MGPMLSLPKIENPIGSMFFEIWFFRQKPLLFYYLDILHGYDKFSLTDRRIDRQKHVAIKKEKCVFVCVNLFAFNLERNCIDTVALWITNNSVATILIT